MTGSAGVAAPSRQLWAMVRLRVAMARTARQRAALVVGAGVLAGIGGSSVILGLLLPHNLVPQALALMAAAVAFYPLVTAALAVASGGGVELVPGAHLVAYPVRPSTAFLASILLLPVNITWLAQTMALVGISAYSGSGLGATVPAMAVVAAYAFAGTTGGQLLGWLAWGAWSRRRMSPRPLLLLAIATAALLVPLQRWWTLDESGFPGRVVLTSVEGRPAERWLLGTGLALFGLAALLLGGPATGWALRAGEPADRRRAQRPYARRRAPLAPLRALLRTDRASVWRSSPLRRGLLLIGLVPAVATALAGLTWADLAVLPALVVSGAALLFGVNAFSLDGPGSLWLASLPVPPRTLLTSKIRVTVEVCAAAVLVALASGAIFTDRAPAPREALVVGLTAVASLAQVVSSAADWSVRRPYRADLRGPRDTPAPPGSMARYSMSLAVRTTSVAVALSVADRLGAGVSALVALAALPVGAAALRLAVTYRRWSEEPRRCAVLVTVATG